MTEAEEEVGMVVNGFGTASDPQDPSVAYVRLSGSAEGPHFSFRMDAQVLDKLAAVLAAEAAKIRKRAS